MIQSFLLLCTVALAAANTIFPFTFSSFVHGPYVCPMAGGGIRAALIPSSTGTPVIESRLALPAAFQEEVFFKYDVLFEEGFEWVKGGKLPGLFGGPRTVHATGCVVQPLNAWSVRLMWARNASIQLYLYDQSRRWLHTPCGTALNTHRPVLQIGTWMTFTIHVKLNSGAGKSDGLVALYIDGIQTLKMDQVQLRGVNGSATIDWALFSLFYGGHDSTWSPSKTTYIQFRNPSCSQTMLQ